MWAMKDGFPFIVVNFGGWHYAKDEAEGKAILDQWRTKDKDTQLYSQGFYSDRIGKVIGKDQWFHVDV